MVEARFAYAFRRAEVPPNECALRRWTWALVFHGLPRVKVLLTLKSSVAPKTNAARRLDQLGIRYELREYEVDTDDLTAETVATKVGLPAQQVFKTLVARGDRNGISMAVIPGDRELDLKALAAAAGERKIDLVPVKELQSLTGYIRGGVTALAAKREDPDRAGGLRTGNEGQDCGAGAGEEVSIQERSRSTL